MTKTPVGKITHFFGKISVAVIELSAPLSEGEKISIEGPATFFTQSVDSMEIDMKKIPHAEEGQSVGMKTIQPVKVGDLVFKADD